MCVPITKNTTIHSETEKESEKIHTNKVRNEDTITALIANVIKIL